MSNVRKFLRALRQSELIPADQVEPLLAAARAFLPPESLEPTAGTRELAEYLIRIRVLTRWQAKQLAQGCSRGFFLGRFRLMGLLGRGGMSVVYRAMSTDHPAGVALKVLTPDRRQRSSHMERFRLEADALCRLRHPNVVRAWSLEYGRQGGSGGVSVTGRYEGTESPEEASSEGMATDTPGRSLARLERITDQFQETQKTQFPVSDKAANAGFSVAVPGTASDPIADDAERDTDDGYWFMVMEYIRGRSLATIVRDEGPLPAREAAEYLRQAAEGLAAIHAAGYVHRDIKPGNFMVEPDGRVRILDLGLARLGEETPDGLTPRYADRLFGTADYLPPEQVRNSHIAGVESDIYSLGATFYAMLTGQPPFLAELVAEKLEHHLYTPAPDLRVLRPDTPPPLATLARRMLAKKPYQRPRSAGEIADSLTAFLKAATLRETIAIPPTVEIPYARAIPVAEPIDDDSTAGSAPRLSEEQIAAMLNTETHGQHAESREETLLEEDPEETRRAIAQLTERFGPESDILSLYDIPEHPGATGGGGSGEMNNDGEPGVSLSDSDMDNNDDDSWLHAELGDLEETLPDLFRRIGLDDDEL